MEVSYFNLVLSRFIVIVIVWFVSNHPNKMCIRSNYFIFNFLVKMGRVHLVTRIDYNVDI